jgi:hypothetical protein
MLTLSPALPHLDEVRNGTVARIRRSLVSSSSFTTTTK